MSQLSEIDRRGVRQKELFEAALTVFGKRGYHSAQISDIIKEAGVARGTFYLYFKSKREIFSFLLNHIFKEVRSVVETLPREAVDQIPIKIKGNLQRITHLLIEKPEYARVLLGESVSLDAESNQQLKHFYDLLLGFIQSAIRQGQEMGFVRSANIELLSVAILGTIKEIFYQRFLGEIQFKADEAVSELYETVLAMVKK